MKNTVLNISNLTIGYKSSKTVVATDISFSLEKGKLISLIGANGIGKSTLLKTITTSEKPLNGAVSLNGKNIESFSSKELATHLSVVFTEKLPPSNLSAYEVIALGRQPYTNWLGDLTSLDKEKINQAISLVNVKDLLHKKHYELSDGQLQKVLIARALAQDTELLILDEPTTHLDLLHKVAVFKLLKNLAAQTQKCILFSTHDVELAIDFCDEIIVMTSGKTQKNSPENLINSGAFEDLFSGESVVFDREKRKFIFSV